MDGEVLVKHPHVFEGDVAVGVLALGQRLLGGAGEIGEDDEYVISLRGEVVAAYMPKGFPLRTTTWWWKSFICSTEW